MPEVEGALVEVIQYQEVVASGNTDANGEIEFTLPIGTYFARISKNGYITHTYMMECLVAKETRVLNLPIEPIWIMGLQFVETMIEAAPSVSANSEMAEETMQLQEPNVTIFTQDPVETLALSASVDKSPTTWRLQIIDPSSNDGGQNVLIPADAISPAVGNTDSGAGVTVPTIATTKQFLLYWNSKFDSTTVNDNGAVISEAVGTSHNYTVAAQTLGSRHRYVSFFRKAWEAVVSVDGAGSTSKTGTYEVLEGTTFNVIATADVGHLFLYWTLNGKLVSSSANYTFTEQEPACSHQLRAHFL